MTTLAIYGAASVIGRELVSVLTTGESPDWFGELRLFGSATDGFVRYRGSDLDIQVARPESLDGVDIALLGNSACVDAGAVVISPISMDPEAPLVLPGINSEAVDDHRGVIRIPDGASAAVATLAQAAGSELARVTGTVLQPASVLGPAAIEELYEQTRALFAHGPVPDECIGGRLAFNVLPGRPTTPVAALAGVPVSLSSVLVPVFGGTTLVLDLWFEGPVEVQAVEQRLTAATGIEVWDEAEPADVLGASEIRATVSGGGDDPVRILAVVDEVRVTAVSLLAVAREVVAQEAF